MNRRLDVKVLCTISILILLTLSNSYAITVDEGKAAMLDGDTVYFYSQDARAYVTWKRAELPGASFKTSTIDNGIILGLIHELRPVEGNLVETWMANIGGKAISLDSLYLTKADFRVALKAALQARIDAIVAIMAVDEDHITSVDDIGDPVLVTSESALDFGDSTDSMDFDVTNSGDGKLVWVISSDTSGVTVSDASGDTKKETDTITVSVDRSGMDVGTHKTIISIESDGGKATIEVTLVVP